MTGDTSDLKAMLGVVAGGGGLLQRGGEPFGVLNRRGSDQHRLPALLAIPHILDNRYTNYKINKVARPCDKVSDFWIFWGKAR